MALIDFKCRECGEKFFEIVKSSDKDSVKCPKCNSQNVNQIFEGKAGFGAIGKSGSSGHNHSGG